MHIKVDQSGKVEDPGGTVLAFSNKISRAILIPGSVKAKYRAILTGLGKSKKIRTLMMFAAGVFLLVKDYLNQLELIIVDIEYEGQEETIKNMLLSHIWKIDPTFPKERIVFQRITRQAQAHRKAWQVHRDLGKPNPKNRPEHKVSLKELLALLY